MSLNVLSLMIYHNEGKQMDFGEMLTIFQNENNTELCGLIRDCITPITKLNVALQQKKLLLLETE